jgi:endonuclease/exonuclease/phosphatase family metal-dependent hydrolase
MQLRVLTWNLMHGRAQPSAGRDLRQEFTAALASWEWDVALLQEVPPWWPAELADALGAEYRRVLTSRNSLLALRQAIATRWPDVIKSSGGGANAILARRDRIVAHRTLRLSVDPERRLAHGVWLACGVWLVNMHLSTDQVRGRREAETAATAALGWARGGPLVFGGDLNLRQPQLAGLRHVGARDVDHLFVGQGIQRVGTAEVLDPGTLSDHPPLVATVQLAARVTDAELDSVN